MLEVGRGVDDLSWCHSALFGGPLNLTADEFQSLALGAGDAILHVRLGGISGELDVNVGDTVQAEVDRHHYFEDLAWGTRLTLTKDGALLAVANDDLPVDERDRYGDLSLSWGDKLCERDFGSCTYIGHDLDLVWEEDGSTRVAPYSSARLGPFEIVTQRNFIMESDGFCDIGNQSEYLIARVKP